MTSTMAWMEALLALAFIAAWIVLELVAKRYDKRPDSSESKDSSNGASRSTIHDQD